MIQRKRLVVALTAAALGVGVLAGPPAVAELTGTGGSGAIGSMATETVTAGGSRVRGVVTLVTGDRVTYHSIPGKPPLVDIDPGAGRRTITFRTVGVGDQLEVIPSDAEQLLATGKLDRRLFAVPRLLADGFGDKSAATVPIIVQRSARSVPPGATVRRELPSLGASAVAVSKASAPRAWRDLVRTGGLRKVWLDGKVRPVLDRSVPQIGAPAAWKAGYTGADVTVAVLDTGIDHSHRDVKAAEAKDFTGTRPDGHDDHGHGTHVAGIISGSGAASEDRYKGVAPAAKLLVGKVLDADGSGDESEIIAGMEWAASKARVVNLSLGGRPTDGTDPMSAAVDRLAREHGTLFVVAAGNSGAERTVGTPGAAAAALTVGSVTKQGDMSEFSSRGPRVDSAAKPDVVAPGSDIVSARAKDSPGQGKYTAMSGTSMAAPHVAGLAALLAQQHPTWDGGRLKAAIRSSAQPIQDATVKDQGAGLVDAGRAVAQEVTAESVADFGMVRWPYERQLTRTITYRNDGAAAVELTLRTEADAPAGLVTLAASKVVVPAKGTADVEVTLRPEARMQPGYHSGWIVATDTAGRSARAVVAAELEPESYDVTVQAVDRAGDRVLPSAVAADLTTTGDPRTHGRAQGDDLVFRLRRGRFWIGATVATGDASLTLVTVPELDVRSAQTVRLDARKGRKVAFRTADSPGAVTMRQEFTVAQDLPAGRFSSSMWTSGSPTEFYAVPSVPVTDRPFLVSALEGKKTPATVYNLAVVHPGRIPTTLTRAVHDRDLGRVDDRYHGQGSPFAARRYSVFEHPGLHFGTVIGTEVDAPGRRAQLYSDVASARWSAGWEFILPEEFDSEWEGVARRFRPGTTQQLAFSAAPVRTRAFAAKDERGIVTRVGGGVSAQLVNPAPGFGEEPRFDDAKLTLVRNQGELTKSIDYLGPVRFIVPPGRAAYSLRAEGSRNPGHTKLATRIDTTWTFETPEKSDPAAPLPLISVRATTDIDDNGTVAAGRPHQLKVVVDNPTAPQVDATQLRMRASFDDGANWQDLTLGRAGKAWTTTVTPPAGAGFVSLHSTATTADGSSVDQKVIRSYGVREAGS